VDQQTEARYVPLRRLAEDQAEFQLWNTPLSEAAALGFEYGYSLDRPEALVVWEAQFGDFVNAAQVVIDQFLASAEDKWGLLSGLVLLLPHGFEGQGPEHSSARPERFLQLHAEANLQVAAPTTPAQYFHLLRRQVLRPWRKPLVVLTPKSLLRDPRAASPLRTFETGRFRRVLGDTRPPGASARRVLVCAGKVYYDLLGRRSAGDHADVAVVRLEQLAPFPHVLLREAIVEAGGAGADEVVWVQEEPVNMGAWSFVRESLQPDGHLDFPLGCVGRPRSASPATGSSSSHTREQEELLDRAFAPGRARRAGEAA
jgi:2-oxoglutarate dehydrogenase E1 component